MDAAVSELRAHLSDYLDRAREGAEVVIYTDAVLAKRG